MVAYGFNPSFVRPIQAHTKRQTIRLPRKRHARPGELIQLYQGMRTRACTKIISDPLCIGIDEVVFDLRVEPCLEVNGIPVAGDDAELYAIGDGFGAHPQAGLTAFEYMTRWWQLTHGRILFVGAAIRWDPMQTAVPA